MTINETRPIALLLGVFAVILLISFLISNIQYVTARKGNGVAGISQTIVQTNPAESATVEKPPQPSLTAKSAIAVETNLADSQQVLLSKNTEAQLPIASLTKLMTAIIALDNYRMTDKVTIHETLDSTEPTPKESQPKKDSQPAEDSQVEKLEPSEEFQPADSQPEKLQPEQIYSVADTLQIMLIASNNGAAIALAEKIGVESFVFLMNQRAWKIGMQNTFFSEPAGISEHNYSTAEDLVKLALYVLKNYPTIVQISEIQKTTIEGFGDIENTNQLLGKVPGIIVGKTGFTLDAKECLLLIIYNEKRESYLVNVVLGSENRFLEMQQIIEFTDKIP